MNIPRGERYELCRSVHAEANAIISAARTEMIGATLYLVGRDAKSGELVPDANSCSMCKRMIINAGITRVVIRNSQDEFTAVYVDGWKTTVPSPAKVDIEHAFGIPSRIRKGTAPQGAVFYLYFLTRFIFLRRRRRLCTTLRMI